MAAQMPVRKEKDDTAAVAATDRYLALEAREGMRGGLNDLLNINQCGKVLYIRLWFQVKATSLHPDKRRRRRERKISNYNIVALGHRRRRRQESDPSILFLESLNSYI